jgi:CheY-like chemotaxis protein
MSALILVAEADPFELRLLSELCSTLGYDVVAVGDGGAVLDSIARARPDLLLMNAALPVLDGLQVLRILKGDQDLAPLPVVLATAEGDDEAHRHRRAPSASRRVHPPSPLASGHERQAAPIRSVTRLAAECRRHTVRLPPETSTLRIGLRRRSTTD